MLIVKIWGMPDGDLGATSLDFYRRKLFRHIYECAVTLPPLEVKAERDMLVLFPADQMQYGRGNAILVELYDFEGESDRNDSAIALLMRMIVDCVRAAIPPIERNSRIICIYPKNTGGDLLFMS